MNTEIEAVVRFVKRGTSDKNEYLIAYPRCKYSPEMTVNTSVICYLEDWEDNPYPSYKQIIILGEIYLYEQGWRALRARGIQFKISDQDSNGGEK